MKNYSKVIGIATIVLLYACQEKSPEVNLDINKPNWSVNQFEEEQKIALMTDALHLGQYEEAQKHFQWLIKENPKLSPNIYNYGLKIYQGLIDKTEDPATKIELNIEMEAITTLKQKYFPQAD